MNEGFKSRHLIKYRGVTANCVSVQKYVGLPVNMLQWLHERLHAAFKNPTLTCINFRLTSMNGDGGGGQHVLFHRSDSVLTAQPVIDLQTQVDKCCVK